MAYDILQYFSYDHLPAERQQISRLFANVANDMARDLPRNAETAAGLRHLLEAKDCFVRSIGSATVTTPDGT
jgi:hypothetical protein